MDKTLFQNISEGVERQQMLLDNADGVEEISFTRMLTPEQIADLKDELPESDYEILPMHPVEGREGRQEGAQRQV